MAHYKDGKAYVSEQDYAPADRKRLSLVRGICDEAVYPGWFDSLEAETRCNVMEAILAALEQE